MLTSYLIIVVSVPVVGFISALKHGAFSLTLRNVRTPIHPVTCTRYLHP
jgi:hypothetical protein